MYLPGAGWVDFDPTNSIIGNRHLIRVAVAWNHYQALPLWGTWNGTPGAFRGLEVEVSVTEIPAEDDASEAEKKDAAKDAVAVAGKRPKVSK
jgi:transglutaminase-like putative cysteine protease